MSAYPQVPFLEAVRDATGGHPKVPRKRYLLEGPVPVLDQGQDFIAGYTAMENAYTGQLPVVLFGDHTRTLKYVDFPFALGADGVKVLAPKEGFEASFLYWYLRNAHIPSAGYSRHFKFLREVSVCKPPLSEQRRIVDILNRAARIEALCSRAAVRLREFVSALFVQMFGDPVLNPRGLPTVALGDLIKVSSGNGLTSKRMDPTGKYPVYGGNGISGYHSEYMFEEPKIVIGRVGVYCGAVHFTEPKSWITDNALYIKDYRRPVNKTYLHWALKSANLNQYAGRAAQPLISGSRIYPVRIAYPNDDAQVTFSSLVHRQERLLATLSKALQRAKDVSFSLAQRTM